MGPCLVHNPKIISSHRYLGILWKHGDYDQVLLDEPLSNLDAKLRRQVREDIRAIQQELGLTVVYVTHDQEEALAVSDEIVVMRNAAIAQIGGEAERLVLNAVEGAGFIGIAVSLMGRNHPVGIVLAIAGMACLAAGAVLADDLPVVEQPELAPFRAVVADDRGLDVVLTAEPEQPFGLRPGGEDDHPLLGLGNPYFPWKQPVIFQGNLVELNHATVFFSKLAERGREPATTAILHEGV